MSVHIEKTACLVMQEQYGFAAKMRNQAIEQLKALETWVERQATGLDMAANPESLRQSFDKLLKVSPAACVHVSEVHRAMHVLLHAAEPTTA
jgi:methylphosphotriester-DNA--protein-cysteine methyltransferase